MTRETQHQRVLQMLMLGHEIDLTMCNFTTKLSTRVGEIEKEMNLSIDRGWRKLNDFTHPVRTYKLKT